MNGFKWFTDMRIDLHVHSKYSGHSLVSLEEIMKRCQSLRLDSIALVDHNTIEGGLKLKRLGMRNIIIGEEIYTAEGEITGLFLNESIPKGLTLDETMDHVNDQAGLIYIPHPFDRLRGKSIQRLDLDFADIVEVFNSRTLYERDNCVADRICEGLGLVKGVGSDAHIVMEIGNSYVEMEPFDSPKMFLDNLKRATLWKSRSPIWVHGITKVLKRIINET